MKSKFLIDTNIWIFFIHGDKNIAQRIIDAGKDACCMSIITAYELLYGAFISKNRDVETAKVRSLLKQFDIIPLPDAEVYARHKQSLLKRSKMIDDLDIMIATTAIANGMTVVTDNVKHFSHFDNLVLENWRRRD